MVGWLSEPHGYGFNDEPGFPIVYGLPSTGISRSRSAPPPNTWKNPHCPSRPSSPPVKPREASSAATAPFSAARAEWSGLVIDPKLTRTPLDMLDAIVSMWRTCAGGMFISFAAAAAAPNVPIVPVEWKPRL